jgi:outer membrane protein assembly factor BamB
MLVILFTGCGLFSGNAVPEIKLNWRHGPVIGCCYSVVDGDNLLSTLVNSNSFTSVYYDLNKREQKWIYPEEGLGLTTNRFIEVGPKAIAVAGQTGKTWFVNRDGELLYTFITGAGADFGARPTFYNELFYLPNSSGFSVYNAENPSKPTLLWKKELNIAAMTVSEDGMVYVGRWIKSGLGAPQVFAYDQDGKELWSTTLDNPDEPEQGIYPKGMIVYGDYLVISTTVTGLVGLDRKTGKRLWFTPRLTEKTGLSENCEGGSVGATELELGDGLVYANSTSGTCVYAINPADGKVAWFFRGELGNNTTITFGGKPKYHNGVLYAYNGYLYALDGKTGQVLAASKKYGGGATRYYPVYWNNQIIVVSDYIYSFETIR